MITVEKVEEAWANYERYKETAEQHEFPKLLMLDLKLKPFYDDLHKHWNEDHAKMFMDSMRRIGMHLGFGCPTD